MFEREIIDARREHYEHEYGMMTEAQNAFALSQMERRSDDSKKIDEALNAGLFVIVRDVDEYCPRTDAAMGVSQFIISVHSTRAEAEAELEKLGDDVDAGVLPRLPTPKREPVDYSDPDIPF